MGAGQALALARPEAQRRGQAGIDAMQALQRRNQALAAGVTADLFEGFAKQAQGT